jgi:pilus assembly protein CpaF
MCTIHANTARDALTKLCTLPLLAGRNIDASFVVPTVASCIDLVVHLGMDRDGGRHVAEIAATSGAVFDSVVEIEPIFTRRAGVLEATGALPPRPGKYDAGGLDPAIVLVRDAA